ncbi:hypothetical protein ACIP1T_24115 [Pseudomonas japonica]|uniref:hypothetical protein n=1 Tax=Pseudomonas japonica TaxID=256466 RepID=UPI0037FE505B
MTRINEEFVVNGDFVMGNLDGWIYLDKDKHKVMEYEAQRNCVVQLPAPPEESLNQYFWAGPGTYRLSFTHRATDENGIPQDVRTIHAGGISYVDRNGMGHSTTVLLVSKLEWDTTSRDVTITQDHPPVEVHIGVMNIDNSTEKRDQEYVESPFAITDISFLKIS